MEHAVREGRVTAVLDLTITELADELLGGIASAGPDRLEAAGEVGVPQAVAPGALDMVNFGPPETVPLRYLGRRLYRHSPQTTLMRTTPEENAELGRIVAAKLNRARGPAAVVVPRCGFSAYDSPNSHWPDPQAVRAFVEALRSRLSPRVGCIEVDDHINGDTFCRVAARTLLGMLSATAGLTGRD